MAVSTQPGRRYTAESETQRATGSLAPGPRLLTINMYTYIYISPGCVYAYRAIGAYGQPLAVSEKASKQLEKAIKASHERTKKLRKKVHFAKQAAKKGVEAVEDTPGSEGDDDTKAARKIKEKTKKASNVYRNWGMKANADMFGPAKEFSTKALKQLKLKRRTWQIISAVVTVLALVFLFSVSPQHLNIRLPLDEDLLATPLL